MPYLEDGETWDDNQDVYDEGMAENRPGHKKFSSYVLPRWAKHPLSHPFNGVNTGPKEYMFHAGDGLCNPIGFSVAHVGAKYGDVALLEMANEEELSRATSEGHTPAHYCVTHGTPWCLQWLVEKGVDTRMKDNGGKTPEELIWASPDLHMAEQEWLFQASRGELTEKNSQKAQEYLLVKKRASGTDPVVAERLDKDMLKLRKFWYNMGSYEKPYPLPEPEGADPKPLDLPSSKVAPREMFVPPINAALMFPGQGSQYVGMMKDVANKPPVKEMLEKAKDLLGWDPLELALNGTAEKIAETRYCQPLVFLAGLAGLEVLKEARPDIAHRCQAVAGLSLGEYTALVAAGVLDFEDGLRLVKCRAEAMQAATQLAPQLMATVAGLDRSKVDELCERARALDPSPSATCQVANFLFAAGFSCSGTQVAIREFIRLATEAKALQAREIKTGGAFHTKLMLPAQAELSKALDEVAERMRPPRCAIYFNATGRKVNAGADPATFIELLKIQLTSEVLWEPSIKAMIMDGVRDFYEVGPLKQLKSMIKRIDQDAFKRTENVAV
mmetsp:Transcript_18205/g.39959  ORF Transcript_18205/g.39959 Transcript_18205/m.39959 type:complete len:556 (-) Transcript_18205:34-1701(-)